MLLRPRRIFLMAKIRAKVSSIINAIKLHRWRYVALFLIPIAVASAVIPSAEQIMVAIENAKPIAQREKEAREAALAYRRSHLKAETDKKNNFEVSDVNKFSDLKPIPDSAKIAKEEVKKKPANEGKPTKEDESKRTLNSRTYANSLGGEVTIASPTEQNFVDTNNKLSPISTVPEVDKSYAGTGINSLKELELKTNQPVAYKNTKGSVQANYLPINSGGIKVSYEGKSFSINPDTKAVISPTKSDKTNLITYKNVWNNVDLEYDYRGTALKESIILNSKPQSNKFVFNLNGAKAVINPDDPSTFLLLVTLRQT